MEKHTAEYAARFANPMVGAQRGFIDAIIEPEDTRSIICNDLHVLRTKKLDNIPSQLADIVLCLVDDGQPLLQFGQIFMRCLLLLAHC